jgi:hypothetical protein
MPSFATSSRRTVTESDWNNRRTVVRARSAPPTVTDSRTSAVKVGAAGA